MRRIVKEIKETIRLELGRIKIHEETIGFEVHVYERDFGLSPNDVEIKNDCVNIEIKDVSFSSNDGTIVKDGTLDSLDFSVIDCSVFNEFEVKEGAVDPEIFGEEIKDVGFIDSKNSTIQDLKIEKIETSIRSFNMITSSYVHNGMHLGQIWRVSIVRSKITDKEKILSALERLLKKYKGRVEDIKFLGYFKGVPLGMSKEIYIDGEKLIVVLDAKKRHRKVVVDLVIIKTPKGLLTEVVK